MPPSAPQSTQAASAAIDWGTFGFDRSRTGYNPRETVLTPSSVRGLVLKWRYAIATKSNTQPIVASRVKMPSGQLGGIVYVGDEFGNFYAIDATAGTLIWKKALGRATTPCGVDSDGVTSAPVLDRANKRVYVLDGLGTIWAFDLATGAQSPGFPPKKLWGNPKVNHTWSGLLLSVDGSEVYYPTASHCDMGTYYGTINAINTTSQAVTTFDLVTDKKTYFGNGVWSWGGESIDPDTGNLFAGVGNSLGSLGEKGQYSDSIIELSPSNLSYVADEQPESDLQNDWDIGTTPVPFDDQGECLAFERKDGNFFILDRTHLENGKVATKLNLGGQLATPAFDPVTHALYANVPNGLTKLALGANCTATIAWQTPIGSAGVSPPVVADGVVYAAGKSKLYAVDAQSGAILWNSGTTIGGTLVPGPSVVNGHVYVAAWDGAVYAFGL